MQSINAHILDLAKDIQSPTKTTSAHDDLTDSPMSFGKVDCQVRTFVGIRPIPCQTSIE